MNMMSTNKNTVVDRHTNIQRTHQRVHLQAIRASSLALLYNMVTVIRFCHSRLRIHLYNIHIHIPMQAVRKSSVGQRKVKASALCLRHIFFQFRNAIFESVTHGSTSHSQLDRQSCVCVCSFSQCLCYDNQHHRCLTLADNLWLWNASGNKYYVYIHQSNGSPNPPSIGHHRQRKKGWLI